MNLRELFRASLPHTLSAMTTRAAVWALALALVACGDSDGESSEPLADAGSNDSSSFDTSDPETDGEADAAGVVLPNGCCSTDERTRPGQVEQFDEPNACGTWDYNCDGRASPMYTGTVSRCRSNPIGGCDPMPINYWLDEEPACGESGTFVLRCTSSCGMDTERRVQRCN